MSDLKLSEITEVVGQAVVKDKDGNVKFVMDFQSKGELDGSDIRDSSEKRTG